MDVGDPILAEDEAFAHLSSNFGLATGTTTLANVTGLVVPVVANAIYEVRCRFRHSNAAGTTEDVKYGFSFPTGSTMRMDAIGGTAGGVSGTTSTDMTLQSDAVTSGSTAFPFGASTSATSAYLDGILAVGSTAGNLQVMAAQNTSGANATSVLIFSYIVIERRA